MRHQQQQNGARNAVPVARYAQPVRWAEMERAKISKAQAAEEWRNPRTARIRRGIGLGNTTFTARAPRRATQDHEYHETGGATAHHDQVSITSYLHRWGDIVHVGKDSFDEVRVMDSQSAIRLGSVFLFARVAQFCCRARLSRPPCSRFAPSIF